MNKRKLRYYDEKLKFEALELLGSNEESPTQLEQELKITRELLPKWRTGYQGNGKSRQNELVASEIAAVQAKTWRLRRELTIAEWVYGESHRSYGSARIQA